MDRIASHDWTSTFSKFEETSIHKSPRYSETIFNASEPGLASVTSRIMGIPGMMVQFVNIEPERNLELFDSQNHESIESAFILNGLADSTFNDRRVVTTGNSHAFQYSPYMVSSHQIASKGLEALHINYEMNFFNELLLSSNVRELEEIGSCIVQKKRFIAGPSQLPLQVRMMEIINAIRGCNFSSLTKSLFIEAKLLELLSLQIEAISGLNQPKKEVLSKTDKEVLLSVKEFIENHYLEMLSLTQICRMFGINEFKLKKGYKVLFDTTVFGHIYNLRMNKASTLLKQGELTINEVAQIVGYSNSANFSSEFKKRFGYRPSVVKGL